jgi:hypothetical protein
MRVLLPKARRSDHGLAEVAVATVLPAEGMVPVTSGSAEVACVLDPEAPAVPPPRVALVEALAPGERWREAGERFAVVDERARSALVSLGVPEARVVVTGWPLSPVWKEAAAADREELRQRFGLTGTGPVVLVDTRELGEQLGPVILQLSLSPGIEPLFDAPDEATTAVLRSRCPAAGIRARRFGETPEAPLLWRAADLVVGRPRPQLVAQARAVGLAIVALKGMSPASDAGPLDEAAEAEGVALRGLGRTTTVAALAAALELLGGERLATARATATATARLDAARSVAALLGEVVRHREAILNEPRPVYPKTPIGPLEEVGLAPEEYRQHEAERLAARIAEAAGEQELEERLAALKARLKKPS